MKNLEDRVRSKLVDDFSDKVLTGAIRVASDVGNPIRLNLFAAAIRELFGHSLHTLAPDEDLKKCPWFEQAPDTSGPTRRQRAKYCTQGGISDEYVKEIGVDVDDLQRQLKPLKR